MYARLFVVGALLGVALPASARVLTDSVADYSAAQGQSDWQHGSYSMGMTTASLRQLQVFQDNTMLVNQVAWSRFIAGDDNVGVTAPRFADGALGSRLDFVLASAGGNEGADASRPITAVPAPGVLALLGLAGLLAFRRKRT